MVCLSGCDCLLSAFFGLTSTRLSDAIFAGTSKWVEGGDEAQTPPACDSHKQTPDWSHKDPAAQDSLHIPHNVRAVSG